MGSRIKSVSAASISFFLVIGGFVVRADEPLSAERPATAVESRVRSEVVWDSYFRRVHPAVFFNCWGRPTEQNDQRQTSVFDKTAPSAHNAELVDVGAGGEIFRPATMDWNTGIDEDFVFKVSFEQKLTTEATRTQATECNEAGWGQLVRAAATELTSRATVTVPEGVYLLRIRRTAVANNKLALPNGIQSWVDGPGVQTIGETGPSSVSVPASITREREDIVFVRPGQNVVLAVEWHSPVGLQSSKFQINFEIRFVSGWQCEKNQILGPPENLGLSIDRSSPDGVPKLTGALGKILRDPLTTSDGDYVLRVGCLRYPKYRSELMWRNHGRDYTDLLRALTHHFGMLRKSNGQGASRSMQEVAIGMTMADLTRDFMRETLPLCSASRVRSMRHVSSDIAINLRSYQWAAWDYAAYLYLLSKARNLKASGLVQSIEKMEASKQTYLAVGEQLHSVAGANELLNEAFGQINSSKYRVVSAIRQGVSNLPLSQIDRNARLALLDLLKDVDEKAVALNGALFGYYQRFENGFLAFEEKSALPASSALTPEIEAALNRVEASELRQAVRGYDDSFSKMYDAFKRNIDWFKAVGPEGSQPKMNSSKFWEDLFFVSSNAVMMVQAMKEYEGPLKGFINATEMEAQATALSECAELPTPNSR